MRLRILLAKVNPEAITVPTRCIDSGCSGRKFHLRKASDQIPTRYRLSCGAGASLSVFEVQTHLSGPSRGDDACPDFTTSERASSDVVSPGG